MAKPNQTLKSEIEFTRLRYVRCNSGSVLRTQKGFTLIELMIVVAIIGILAGLAVTFFGSSTRKSKAKAEVAAMFAEIQVKQEQNMLEFNTYGDCGATNDEDNMFPAVPLSNGNRTDISGGLPAQWTTLRIDPGRTGLLCGYTCVHGAPGDNASVGLLAQAEFGYGLGTNLVPAADAWYYVLAHCDMDTDALDSYYFKNSADSHLYFTNQGH